MYGNCKKKNATLQETSERHTPNKYKKNLTAYMEAAAIKPRAKCRVPLESLVVR